MTDSALLPVLAYGLSAMQPTRLAVLRPVLYLVTADLHKPAPPVTIRKHLPQETER
jgi:hypothetical protein